ncbi:hypothetical protein VSP10_12480 [Myroides odoratimimus]|uniref:hypothetical protein n=1 Tax=Myroides odoratimimus TaxID=76832 RepID=UPI000245F8EC|nr:hypothetical protein [Myroides odoratimimus]EHO07909.1 hypothetical protein HMPREF9714_02383 [Myroides odoratimimus CCUG 12901]MEC4053603.1 hypothetical protein [Myroides odoratimimus]
MRNRFYIISLLLVSLYTYGQTGINTPTPLTPFHIDGKKDNPSSGTPSKTAQQNDVVISVDGNLGIGTITPLDKLTINNENLSNTGLQLTSGAGHGNILISDTEGNTTWASASNPISIMETPSETITINGIQTNWGLVNKFSSLIDETKAVYGSEYGWDSTNQLYRVPKDGNYRVTLNVVCGTSDITLNWRVAVVLNNKGNIQHATMHTMPFISVIPHKDKPQNSIVTGIVNLKKNDFLQVKIANFGVGTTGNNNPVILIGGPQETRFTVEMM